MAFMNEKVLVSEMAILMKKDVASHVNVTQFMCRYIKEHSLHTSKKLFKLDETLQPIFGRGVAEEFSYVELQTLIGRVLLRENGSCIKSKEECFTLIDAERQYAKDYEARRALRDD